ncbi:hypothetical protein PM082_014240 [Marasmius tenuissimus]|nr:hypothetical protein PM082_014240 [Marasmius tenuissimus]
MNNNYSQISIDLHRGKEELLSSSPPWSIAPIPKTPRSARILELTRAGDKEMRDKHYGWTRQTQRSFLLDRTLADSYFGFGTATMLEHFQTIQGNSAMEGAGVLAVGESCTEPERKAGMNVKREHWHPSHSVLPSPAIPLSGHIIVDSIVPEPSSLTTRESALEQLEGTRTTSVATNGPNVGHSGNI